MRDIQAENKTKGFSMAVIGPSLWGLMSIFTRQMNEAGVTGKMICAVRGVVTGGLFILLFALFSPKVLKTNGKGLLASVLYGVFCYGIGYLSYIKSVELIPVAVATVLMFTCPVWVILFGILFFKEKPTKLKILAVILCLSGCVLVSNVLSVRTGGTLSLLGILAGILNAVCAALQIMIPRLFNGKIEKNTMICYGYFASGLVMIPFMNIKAFSAISAGPEGPAVWKSLLMISILCTLVANYCYINASSYLDTTLVGILSAFEVVVGTIVSVFYFKETLSVPQMIGFVLIVYGALLPSVRELKRKPEKA